MLPQILRPGRRTEMTVTGAGFVRVSSMREAFWPGAPKAAFLPAGERETTAYLFRRPVCPADLVGLWTGR